jgi:fumarate reductase flavoprotein subunit
MAMALRAELPLRDMEMVQFHPTGLLAGADTRITGTVLEEGLRGAGGYLLNGNRKRFMARYDPRAERATRDIVSRGMIREIQSGNVSPLGGLYLQMSHLGPDNVRAQFKGMVERCADCGFDLAGGLVEVVPTAHYMMGGVEFSPDTSTALRGLYAAGEDTGGVHGANRLGGNGVANSTVFGRIAGDVIGAKLNTAQPHPDPDEDAVSRAVAGCRAPLSKPAGEVGELRDRLYEIMWNDVGVIRDARGLERAERALEDLHTELLECGVDGTSLAFNLSWHEWLNLENLVLVSRAIARSALARNNSRGAHYREDFIGAGELDASTYVRVTLSDGRFESEEVPVDFSKVRPGETLLELRC